MEIGINIIYQTFVDNILYEMPLTTFEECTRIFF